MYPSLAVIVAFVGALGLRYFGETRQRRRVTALFSQYVPETVAQRLVDEDRASIAVEGERLDMTVMFCDLRGFTALSESLSPAIVRAMLNHYYDRVTDVVLGSGGTLMKYVGDEVFAVWGAPLPSTDHPQRALDCAIAIQALTPDLNRELVELGAPAVAFGIGLNTGEAVAAHFGGGRRRQYDVVGDTVNIGAPPLFGGRAGRDHPVGSGAHPRAGAAGRRAAGPGRAEGREPGAPAVAGGHAYRRAGALRLGFSRRPLTRHARATRSAPVHRGVRAPAGVAPAHPVPPSEIGQESRLTMMMVLGNYRRHK